MKIKSVVRKKMFGLQNLYTMVLKINHNQHCTLNADAMVAPFVVEDLESSLNPWNLHPTDIDYESRSNRLFRGSQASGQKPADIVAVGGLLPRFLDAPENKKGLSNVDRVEGTVVHTSRSEKVARQFTTSGGWVISFKASTGVNVMYLRQDSDELNNVRGESNNYSKRESEIFVEGVPLSHIEFIRPIGAYKMFGYANKIIWNTEFDPSNDWFRIEHGSFDSSENEKGNVAARAQGVLTNDTQMIPAAWANTIYTAIGAEFPGLALNLGTALCMNNVPTDIKTAETAIEWLLEKAVQPYMNRAGEAGTTEDHLKSSALITSDLARRKKYLTPTGFSGFFPKKPIAILDSADTTNKLNLRV